MSDTTVKIEKKLSKKSFTKLAKAYKKQTKEDLCTVVQAAQQQSIRDIQAIKPEKMGKDLRVHLFKLADYEYLLGFCRRKKKPMVMY